MTFKADNNKKWTTKAPPQKACECGSKSESEAPASQLDARKQFTLDEKNALLKIAQHFQTEQIDKFIQEESRQKCEKIKQRQKPSENFGDGEGWKGSRGC